SQSIQDVEIAPNSLDKSFLSRSMQIIEEHLSDPMFSVETFATLMHASRMTLYRKFKALTGESPSDCIRRCRMEKAAELLQTGKHNISEVSDLVGMQDLSYFSTAFKKHFRMSPSEYLSNAGIPSRGRG
ncbi:MAG: AraC family transcriptional regulator, partial [Verrucomicrobiae bacterium]|nr:AraC family transcriptional regulator [Verrucomicrobiae bacterium]